MATRSDHIAWLFPGQGTQAVGMGRELIEASSAAREMVTRADKALGESLTSLILEGPEEALTLTANAQPAIVAVSAAVHAAIKERIPSLPLPRFSAGHSLGEYSALVAAGALIFEDAVRIVRARGRAMQEAVAEGTGAMAAVMGLSSDDVRAACEAASQGEVVSPANFNAPGQIVIAGAKAAVERASGEVGKRGGKSIPLKVSAPFHCALMAPAAKTVDAELSKVSIGAFAFPVIANFDAEANEQPNRVRELLVRQVDGAVRWEETVQRMHSAGITHAIEIGPGKVLAGLVKRIAKEIKVHSVSDLKSLDALPAFLAEASS